jgi:hypothetical protein
MANTRIRATVISNLLHDFHLRRVRLEQTIAGWEREAARKRSSNQAGTGLHPGL